jgi:pyrroline-5-carboxylate reductase
MADALLGAVGAVEWLSNESQIDAVTAVSGSGPAYVFLLAESLARAGEAAGLPADLSARLARATIEGSGELMRLSPDVAPSKLRENVTSPGGTTAAALGVLMGEEGLDRPMKDAVLAALRRAGELSG